MHDKTIKKSHNWSNHAGIEALYPRKKRHTSVKNPEHKIYGYPLGNIEVSKPNQVWCGDITYIRLQGGFAYLAAVMDRYSKKVLAWKLSATMGATLSTDVLGDAIASHGKPKIFKLRPGVAIHSQRTYRYAEKAPYPYLHER